MGGIISDILDFREYSMVVSTFDPALMSTFLGLGETAKPPGRQSRNTMGLTIL